MPTKLLKREWLISIALVVVTLIVYWKVTGASFVNYDDPDYIIGNPHVQEGLSWDSLKWAFTATDAQNWHPLTWISHILDFQLYGANPSGHHLTSLIIHSANAALLFWTLYLMTTAVWPSAFVAALFALHPLNVESVAWVSERKNVLCTLFWILALLAYVLYSRKPQWRRFIPVIIFFALGLMSKPMVITLPFVLLLLDYWPLNRLNSRPSVDASSDTSPDAERAQRSRRLLRLLVEKSLLLPLVIASSVITVLAQRKGGAIISGEVFSLPFRLENAIYSYARYLGKMIWPVRLAVFYPHPRPSIATMQLVLSGAVLVLITALAVWKMKKSRYVIVGWVWYAATLVPVIGLVQVGAQAMADRYTYIPLIGLFIGIAWSAAEWSKASTQKRSVLIVIGVSALTALALVTRVQVNYWKSTVALFDHAAAVTNGNYLAYGVLGAAYAKEGRLDDAVVNLEKSLEYDRLNYNAEHILGIVLLQKGQTGEAIDHFRRAVEIDPNALDGYNILGAALLDSDRVQEAVPCFLKVLEIDPNHPLACANLGFAFDREGKLDDAMAWYKKALGLTACNSRPDDCLFAAQLNYRIGDIAVRKGLLSQAAEFFREALRIRPGYPEAQQSLARITNERSR
ncbi:MAG TPA: tetratricopeptide repeat protein [Blastocatellia bacterium]|nr:tetratricopeptide repeat protein [Blastocatellia bacterium]